MESDSRPPNGAGGVSFEPLAGTAEACAVRLPIFEGPLDLLLHLIRENELEITDLSIARVAEQYLEYLDVMRELELDVAAEYLVMAATLAWIKSRLLLPVESEGEEGEGPDPRAELVARLLEYQRYKEVAEDLEARPRLERDLFPVRGSEIEPPPEGEREIEVGLLELLRAMRGVLARARSGPGIHEVEAEPVTLRDRMLGVLEQLERFETTELEDLFRTPDGAIGSRSWIVATFLAILELARVAALRLYQGLDDGGCPSGPVRVRRAFTPGERSWSELLPEGV